MSKFSKIFLMVLAALALIFVGVYFYIFHFGGIENLVTAKIDTAFGKKYNLDIKIGDIDGDLMSGIVLRHVIITYKDSTTSINLAEIPRLEAHYSLSGLLSGDFDFNSVVIDSAKLMAIKRENGGWVVPPLAPGGYKGNVIPKELAVSVGNLQINNASLTIVTTTDTVNFTEINLAASIQVFGKTYAADLERLSAKSDRQNLQLDYGSGKITFADGVISFQDFNVGRGTSRIKMTGQFDIKQFLAKINIAADNLDLNEISQYAGLNLHGHLDINGDFELNRSGLKGSVDLGGSMEVLEFKTLHADLRYSDKHLYLDTVYGTVLDQCAIDGKGSIDLSQSTETYELRSRISGFNLNSLISGAFVSDLNGDIYLRGRSFRTKSMVLEVDAGLYESSFDDYHLHSAIGSMQITADSIVFFEPFVVKYFENRYSVKGRINYKDSLDLSIAAQLDNLERYQGKLFIEKPAGRGQAEARLTGKTKEPNLHVKFESDSAWIYGLFSNKLNVTADVDRFLTGKQGNVEVKMGHGSAWDVPVDSGYALLAVDYNLVTIDSIFLNNQYSTAVSHGIFDYGAAPKLLTLDALHLTLFGQEFYNDGTIEIGIDSSGFDFRKATLAHKDVSLSGIGQIGFNESLNMNLDLENVLVAPWLKLFDAKQDVNGAVSGKAELHGLLRNPDFKLKLNIDSLTFGKVVLGKLTTNLKYSEQLLSIDSLVLKSEQGRYIASGTVPIDLSLTTTVRRLLDRPMNLSVSARDQRFDLVTSLLPTIEQLDGDFVADFRVFGTPDEPHIEGMAYLKNGRLKYFDLEQIIYSDSASVTMTDNKIIIDNIEAYAFKDNKSKSTKRYAKLEGEITVKALDRFYYDVYVTLPREFPFSYELADIRGSIEGEMHVEGDTPPMVTGNLTLVAMRYEVNFASPDEGSPIMAAFSEKSSWNLNLNIDILSNYWIKNDDIDGQFTGFINLLRDKGHYRFIGDIEVVRGRGFLFDKIFTLEPGGTVTFEGGDSLNPQLDLTGYTRVTSYVASEYESDRTAVQKDLGIHITGTLDYPEINPTQDTEVSGEELLPLLAGTSYGTSQTSSFGSFEQRLSGLVGSQLSQIGGRQLTRIGVETFELSPGFYQGQLDLSKTLVTLGFSSPFDPNLYIYGRSALGSSSGQEIGFEYRRFRKFILEGRRDEDELYHVNLKLNWEF